MSVLLKILNLMDTELLSGKMEINIFGNGDKWYNDIYLSYNLSYDHGKESHTKKTEYKSIQYSQRLKEIVYDFFKEDFLNFNYLR